MSTSQAHHGADPVPQPVTRYYTSWFTSFLSSLQPLFSRGGGSPEDHTVVQPTCASDCRNIVGDGQGKAVQDLPAKNASVISPTDPLPFGSSPQRPCSEKNKEVVIDVDIEPLPMEKPCPSLSRARGSPFYGPGESSRLYFPSSPTISETRNYSLSSSFSSRGTRILDSFPRDHRAILDLCYLETELSSSSSSSTPNSPIFCPKIISPKFSISTPRTESQTLDESQSAAAAPPRPGPRPPPGNVFRQQELSKHVVAFTVSFSPGVMILHHSSPQTMTWGMSVVVVVLLSVSVAMLWNSNVMQDEFPVYAHRIQMLGFALALAAFWGLISCFLWPSYTVIVPISCWTISAVILGIKAFSFEAPARDPQH